MEIRRAKKEDLAGVNRLLEQVLRVHHEGRPDLFRAAGKKYNDEELFKIFEDDARPVFVAVEEGELLGYAFCIFEEKKDNPVLCDHKSLYIDDLCVDACTRGKGVGTALYRYVVDFARRSACFNVTLNVWACNGSAMAFYEKMGFRPQKVGMETIL